ncbi:MAG: hypothetical protein JSU77_07615 [Fidelibacterota bacterium]|nr:MAG: hypothetical protein JSU77_07615 [Candidatus Neomarinimicrobiota bacterium]
MTHPIDLKTLERKAYLSYHQDGLLDLGLGMLVLAVGIGWVVGIPWLMGVLLAIGVSSYPAAKKMITIPRVGLVRFSPDRQRREKRTISFFVTYFTFTVLLGVAMFFLVIAVNRNPNGFGRLLEKFIMAPFGLLVAIALAALAYWKQVSRFYLYAALLLLGVFGGPLLGINHAIYFSAPGIVMLLVGLYLLIRFLQTYRLPEEESPGSV